MKSSGKIDNEVLMLTALKSYVFFLNILC